MFVLNTGKNKNQNKEDKIMGLNKSKYHSIKTEVDGIIFDSRKEAKRYRELKIMKAGKIIKDFDLQPEFQYNVTFSANGNKFMVTRRYIADFLVYHNDGREEIEDVKGVRTAEYKRKKKIIEKLYGIKIIEK